MRAEKIPYALIWCVVILIVGVLVSPVLIRECAMKMRRRKTEKMFI